MSEVDVDEKSMSFSVPAIQVSQPIGKFFIASIPHRQLFEICFFDVRRMLKDRDIEEYLGIQRPLSTKRAQELQQYVSTVEPVSPRL